MTNETRYVQKYNMIYILTPSVLTHGLQIYEDIYELLDFFKKKFKYT